MLYYILKYISKGMMRIYFGKVHIHGLENVPRDKPLILAANHQSAFLEPVLLGGIMPFPVHFITRGDIFVKRWMWFFNAVNMIPIFRFHDGFRQMKKNMDSFQHVYDALAKNARVIIFCEGQMKWEKKLHPLQLGAARMAVGAYDQNRDLDIYVIPIGINYEDHLTFRRYVKISFGEAIKLTDHTAEIDESQRPALKSVTATLAERLKPEVIHIGTEEHYELGNQILAIYDNEDERRFFPFVIHEGASLKRGIAVAQKTEKLDQDASFLALVNDYSHKVGSPFVYRDYVLKHYDTFHSMAAIFYYAVVLPLGWLGILLNGVPTYLSNRITHQRTTIPEFIGSLKSNLGSMLVLIYYLVVLVPLTIMNWKLGLISFSIMYISGLFATYYWDRKLYWRAKSYWSKVSKEERETCLELRNQIKNNISG